MAILEPENVDALVSIDPDGSRGFIKRVVRKFADTLDTRMQAIAQACAAQDEHAVVESCHALVSGALGIGANALAEHCRGLERAAQQGDLSEMDQWHARIRNAADQTRAAIAERFGSGDAG